MSIFQNKLQKHEKKRMIKLYWCKIDDGDAVYDLKNDFLSKIEMRAARTEMKKAVIYELETYLTDETLIMLFNKRLNHCNIYNYQNAKLIYEYIK